MGMAKPDFSQMCRSRSDLIENAERFARIDLDLSDFEKERNQSIKTINNLPVLLISVDVPPVFPLLQFGTNYLPLSGSPTYCTPLNVH